MADVTITLPKSDFEDAISDITTVHYDRCISSDECDCLARADRMQEALKERTSTDERNV